MSFPKFSFCFLSVKDFLKFIVLGERQHLYPGIILTGFNYSLMLSVFKWLHHFFFFFFSFFVILLYSAFCWSTYLLDFCCLSKNYLLTWSGFSWWLEGKESAYNATAAEVEVWTFTWEDLENEMATQYSILSCEILKTDRMVVYSPSDCGDRHD